MKKITTTLILLTAIVSLAGAQDRQFKLAKKTGTLNIKFPGVQVQGYDGNEIVFSAAAIKEADKDDRAAGLKLVTGSGLTDNTGLNLSVVEKDGIIDVNEVSKDNREAIIIKVPNSMAVSITTSGIMYSHRAVDVKDFKGNLQVNTMYNAISLQNITGPVTAKTIYGELNADFASMVKGPVSLISVYKFVDVTIPANLKANVDMSTKNGNIYAADGLTIQRVPAKEERNKDGEDVSILTELTRATNIVGTLNGGGLDLILRTSFGKIYLRKH